MASEYELKDYSDGNTFSGDDINSVQSFVIANNIYALINIYEDVNSLYADPTNSIFSIFDGTGFTNGSIDVANSTALVVPANQEDAVVMFGDVFDDCTDDSIDTDKWTTATPHATHTADESDNGIYVSSDGDGQGDSQTAPQAEAVSDGAVDPLDLKTIADDSEVMFYYELTGTATAAYNGHAGIYLTDGSTWIALHEQTKVGGTWTWTEAQLCRVVIDYSAETCDVYLNEVLTQNNLDISSLSKWCIGLSAGKSGSGGNPAKSQIFGLCYIDGSAGSSYCVIQDTATATTKNGICVPVMENETTTNAYFSADSGSNYTATDCNKALVNTSNTGTGIRFKVTGAYPTSLDPTAKNIMTMKAFGAFYGADV